MRVKNIIQQLVEDYAEPTPHQLKRIANHLTGDYPPLTHKELDYLSYLSRYLHQIGVYKKPDTSIIYRGIGIKDDNDMLKLLDFKTINYSPRENPESWTTDIETAKLFMYENSVLIRTVAHGSNIVIQFDPKVMTWLIDKAFDLEIDQDYIDDMVGIEYETQYEILLKREPKIKLRLCDTITAIRIDRRSKNNAMFYEKIYDLLTDQSKVKLERDISGRYSCTRDGHLEIIGK